MQKDTGDRTHSGDRKRRLVLICVAFSYKMTSVGPLNEHFIKPSCSFLIYLVNKCQEKRKYARGHLYPPPPAAGVDNPQGVLDHGRIEPLIV